MTTADVWTDVTARNYDADCAVMFRPEVIDPVVARLDDLAAGGPACEFAVGTGRIAIPLLRAGVPVAGIELSAPMIAQLRAKVGADELPVSEGDMSTATAPGPVGDHVDIDTYDTDRQLLTSVHLNRQPDGSYRRFDSHHRYVWPAELDLMARIAGLVLESRTADWGGTPFTADSAAHVSVYRRADTG